ncbi:MAG: 50S ribosomal protein L6 [Candidatus Omnitrophota bacterium]
MSRIGKQPIVLLKEAKIKIEGNSVLAESSKGKLQLTVPQGIKIELDDNTLVIKRENDTKELKSLHGTIRVLISNMIEGITKGFKKELEIVGVGYKAQMKGQKLVLNMGFSHPVEMDVPLGLKVSTPSAIKISIEGIDKQKVGEFTAKIRRVYPPEPYKGKGIRYAGEEVRKKVGKALAK